MNLCKEMEEQFKPIKDFEGLYEISNLGKVKNLKTNRILKTQILKIGYKSINLCKNSKLTTKYIHRLIATAFIPNLENKPEVNHINGIKTDNQILNLEWTTHKENINHAYRIGLCDAGNIGRKLAIEKRNNKETLDLYTGILYDSLKEACESLNLNYKAQSYKILKNNNTRLQYI
jgi:hypothetical protein